MKVENSAFFANSDYELCVLEILNEAVTEQNVSDSGLVSH
jgi:hypothetical protein